MMKLVITVDPPICHIFISKKGVDKSEDAPDSETFLLFFKITYRKIRRPFKIDSDTFQIQTHFLRTVDFEWSGRSKWYSIVFE